ncbi:MAG: hypothetical protein ACHQ49_15750, partial [Elusimicrobiota bacterium]
PASSPLSGDVWVPNDFSRPLRSRKSLPPEVTGSFSTESRLADSSPLDISYTALTMGEAKAMLCRS